MANENIIYAKFKQGYEITTDSRSQYAYGQVLRISGLHRLPENFDADVSNEGDKKAVARIGSNNELPIDDAFFLSGKDVIVMVNVHETDSDGRTKYIIRIPVKKRPIRADIEITPVEQDIVSTAIATLNKAVEQTSADVESAENSATQAKESATNAEQASTNASNLETLAEQHMERAETAANLAEQKATDASASADTATAKAKEADTSATNAEKSALNAQDSALIAQGYMNSASNYANQAEVSATKAKSSADDAELSKSNAEKMAMDAEESKQYVKQVSDGFDARVEQAIDDVNTAGQAQKELAKEQAEKAEAWAVGERRGRPIKQDDPAYNNNAKYWAGQAHTDSESASSDAQSASASATSAAESAYEASKSADRAEQVAEKAGYLDVEIVNGRLIYTRTDAVDVDFYLEGGRLIMEGV